MIVNYKNYIEPYKNSSKIVNPHNKIEDSSSGSQDKSNNSSKDEGEQYFDKRAEDISKYFSFLNEISDNKEDNFYKYLKTYNELHKEEKEDITDEIDVIA